MKNAIRMFQEVDSDNNGVLSKNNLGDLLDRIGIHLTDKVGIIVFLICLKNLFRGAEQRLTDIYEEFDTNNSNSIDLKEFVNLMKGLHNDADKRIRDLNEVPIMALKIDPTTRYIPPESGRLIVQVFPVLHILIDPIDLSQFIHIGYRWIRTQEIV